LETVIEEVSDRLQKSNKEQANVSRYLETFERKQMQADQPGLSQGLEYYNEKQKKIRDENAEILQGLMQNMEGLYE
jgi:hypothetical protein